MSDPAPAESADRSLTAAAALCDRWADAFNRGDIDGLVRLYTPDVMFFGSLPDLFLDHAGVRDYFRVLADAVEVSMEQKRFRRLTAGTLAMSCYLNAVWRAGERRQYRLTWTLVERDGDWLIGLHHGSLRPAGAPSSG